jgi:hypothetical protein
MTANSRTTKPSFLLFAALALCCGLAFMAHAAMRINPCYNTTAKTCYTAAQRIYNAPAFSCFGYQCVPESWYINHTVPGAICSKLFCPSSGGAPTGRTNCIRRTEANWGTKTVVKRACSYMYGCYVVSTDPEEFCSVYCEQDYLDSNSPECNPL